MHHLEIFLFLIKNQVLSRLYKSRQVSSFLIHKELDPDIQVNWPGRTNFGASDKEFNEAMHVRFIVLYIYIYIYAAMHIRFIVSFIYILSDPRFNWVVASNEVISTEPHRSLRYQACLQVLLSYYILLGSEGI
jgi:hypothetical protein